MSFLSEQETINNAVKSLILKFQERESRLVISNQELNDSIRSLHNKKQELEIKYKLLINENAELKEEAINLNKVSLLKNIHKKYDSLKNKYEVRGKRLDYYKNKVGSNISVTELATDELEEKDAQCKLAQRNEEVNVELIKIKKKRYYIEDIAEDVRNVYAAIKVKKGDYDVGDLVGTYDGKELLITL